VADLPDLKVAGWIQIFREQTVMTQARVEVAGLVVDEKYRGRGIGRALMQHAEAWAREHGCATVSLRSNVIRNEAHAFYKGLGYSLVKTQHAFRKKVELS
jgi:GNAT superfamily N-acetyltransferase